MKSLQLIQMYNQIPHINDVLNYEDSVISASFNQVKKNLCNRNWDTLLSGRFSWYLIIQLIEMDIKKIPIQFLVNEIEHLENPDFVKSEFKPAEQYLHNPLRGLKKKHYGSDSWEEFKRNCINPLTHQRGERRTGDVIRKHYKKNNSISSTLLNSFIELTFQEMVKKAEQGKLTGEWLVFHEFNGKNYYLAKILHEETMIDDCDVEKLIRNICIDEFPQFKGSLPLFDF
jgi:hypothetical protein